MRYLKPLDVAMAQTGLFHARVMDDWLSIRSKGWKLRKVVPAYSARCSVFRQEGMKARRAGNS